MNTIGFLAGVVLLVVAVYFGRNEFIRREREGFRRTVQRSVENLEELKELTKVFSEKQIVKVTDNIYMAIGYALANSIMIIGENGVIIVDVTESYDAAKAIYEEFRKITDKPVTDIIYTHNHADHTHGAKAFSEKEKSPPNVWAHASILKAFGHGFSGVRYAHFHRSMRQFGVFLNTISAGIGLRLNYGQDGSTQLAILYPTNFVGGDEQDVVLAGVPIKIIHIPGETDDQIGVWVPDQKAFLCADDLYKAFPNLYAIRGTKSRALMQWAGSMDKMIALEPEYLVPSHTMPVIGRDTVMTLLTQYRDAIQYVHDQSVRLINHGYHPDEIANMVNLPAALQKNPYLRELYGTVKWSAKSVFIDYQGWFSGDPTELDPLTRGERADKMVELVGVEKLTEAAKEAMKSGEYQWALELSSHVLRNDPSHSEARNVKVEAIVELASRQTSSNGRNYLLTAAMEIATGLKFSTPKGDKAVLINAFPVAYTLDAFSTIYKAEDCETKNQTVYFHFSDPDSHHHIQLRNGVAIVRHTVPKNWDMKLQATEQTWKDVAGGKRSAIVAIGAGDITVEGGSLGFKSFIDCFELEIEYNDL